MRCLPSVPELTRRADIKLNKRLSLRCHLDCLVMSRRKNSPNRPGPPARPSADHTSLDGIVPNVVQLWPCKNQRTSPDFRSSAAFATAWGLSSTAGKMLPPPRSSNAGIVVRHVARWAIYACSLVQGRRACSKFEAPTVSSIFQTVSGNLGAIH